MKSLNVKKFEHDLHQLLESHGIIGRDSRVVIAVNEDPHVGHKPCIETELSLKFILPISESLSARVEAYHHRLKEKAVKPRSKNFETRIIEEEYDDLPSRIKRKIRMEAKLEKALRAFDKSIERLNKKLGDG